MQKSLSRLCASLLVALPVALAHFSVHALASDRNQPMNIEANNLRHDDGKQETVFSGKVLVTKGSIVLRGETLTVRQAAGGQQRGTIQGSKNERAFFSQKRDTPKGAPAETVEGQAQTIEYNSATDEVRLVNQAQLRRYRGGSLNDQITGSVIVYNNRTGFFSVDGQQQQGGRVRAIIGASPEADGTSPARLQSSPAIQSGQ
ncbi:lipopolysaccharide export system protein LptA [Lampropedia hyalina DSM 16112]|uniref:Lipopolysaccharide export system protein LptA n=1 Tax=Lampropedia hyalina DSM 16112 TaxID=1122156 RepID=A0A1M4YS12_9BURK|nr:lipopolysaccharide transport periplasmic protein LptA [Lampropedia hyalina]SHF08560.1 lipopolysaccharide export system protein LptA [Lampropedia hyalina DSM 16112]